MEKCMILISVLAASALAAVSRRDVMDRGIKSRIVGGRDAPEGAFPYQVSLRYRDNHSCGGAIIHPEWVVTAATCVLGKNEGSLAVFAGTNRLTVGGVQHRVIAAYPHENYNSKTEQNNVAILRVQRIDFTNKIGSITLETGYVGGNEVSTLSGWGSTKPSPPPVYSDKLQYIDLKTTTNEYCTYANQNYPITASQICTLTRSGEGSCSGDSGGPLVRTANGVTKLIGIVNWMTSPCAVNKPDVYSRASSYYDWIRKTCGNCI